MTVKEFCKILDPCTGIEVWEFRNDEGHQIFTDESPENLPEDIVNREIITAYPVTDGFSLYIRIEI